MPAVWTDPERRLELVVPIMRLAFRARVRMLLPRRFRRVPVLDGDVDPRRHEPSSLEAAKRPVPGADRWRGSGGTGGFPRYNPRGGTKKAGGSKVAGSELKPVEPGTSTSVLASTGRR